MKTRLVQLRTQTNAKYFFLIQTLCFNMHQKYFMYTSHFVAQNSKMCIQELIFNKIDCLLIFNKVPSSRTFLSETDFFLFICMAVSKYNN